MNVLLFLCTIGNFINCEEPIYVISETDWFAFWLEILLSALITTGSVVLGIILNDSRVKRGLRKIAKRMLKSELTDILLTLNNNESKNTSQTFDGENFSYVPYRFHAISYQSLIESGSLLLLDSDLQGHVRNAYSLITEHNNLVSEIDRLTPNVYLHSVYNYKEYMRHIEGMQVNLTGLEREMLQEFDRVLSRLNNS